MKILILGGYGSFGGRLAELLQNIPDIQLLIAGRSADKAQAFCQKLNGPVKSTPIALNRDELAAHISELAPNIVVDASGPFQHYGATPYSVVETCINNGVHYLDLADSSEFVAGIGQFDEAAKAAKVFVLSGVSTLPVLSSAVLHEISHHMKIHHVTAGIAPSPFAGIGLNVVRAVVAYAGDPVKLKRDGDWGFARGLADTKRYTIAPPGHLPLYDRLFSLVDVPDLKLFPQVHPTIRSLWMGAGPVPEYLHRALGLFAMLRANLNVPSIVPLAPLFHFVLNRLRYGEHRGGMFLHTQGVQDGQKKEISWHLLAEGDDGPYIPSMATELLIRKVLDDKVPAIGARAAIEVLKLRDYETAFSKRSIYTGFRTSPAPRNTLYETLLGSSFGTLPKQLKKLHGRERIAKWHGQAQVKRGKSVLSRISAWCFGFPKQGDGVPVTVEFSVDEQGREHWHRIFDTAKFSSIQSEGTGKNSHLLMEQFGPFEVALALVVREKRLYLIPRKWRFLKLPLPRSLMPTGESFEYEEEGRFHFNVTIKLPLIGLVVAYQGWLEPTR